MLDKPQARSGSLVALLATVALGIASCKSEVDKECEISNGQVFSCGGWYQGKAVVLTDR